LSSWKTSNVLPLLIVPTTLVIATAAVSVFPGRPREETTCHRPSSCETCAALHLSPRGRFLELAHNKLKVLADKSWCTRSSEGIAKRRTQAPEFALPNCAPRLLPELTMCGEFSDPMCPPSTPGFPLDSTECPGNPWEA
jgi:hypothetical protein